MSRASTLLAPAVFAAACNQPTETGSEPSSTGDTSSVDSTGTASSTGDGGSDEPSVDCGDAEWSSNLPLLVIDTNGEEIVDDPRIVARLGIIDNGPGQRNCVGQPLNDYEGQITIEYRGSTSQYHPKKSYGFETQHEDGTNDNVSLLGLPADDDWVLYAPYSDKTMIRNVLAYQLFGDLGHYAARTRYCEVVINGEYWGVHVLTEKVKVGSDRVDIAPLLPEHESGDELTGGYLIKIDKPTGSGSEWWPSAYSDKYYFQYHDPKDLDTTHLQREYIEALTGDFEAALWGDDFADSQLGYRPYVDVDSFIDFLIMHELGRTVDGYRSSTFIHKDRDSVGGKLTMGPVWDFNVSFGHCDYCDAEKHTGWQFDFNDVCPDFHSEIPFWWRRLLEDPAFAEQLRCRWEELRQGPLSEAAIMGIIDDAVVQLEEAQERNFDRWPILGVYVEWNPFVGETWDEDVDYLRDWLRRRLSWMDGNLPGECARR